MRILAILSGLLWLSTLHAENCNFLEFAEQRPITFSKNPKVLLSPFWAQEYIGSDLVKRELSLQPARKVKTGITDINFYYPTMNLKKIRYKDPSGGENPSSCHGSTVSHLFNGEGPASSSCQSELIFAANVNSGNFGKDFEDIMALFKGGVELVNASHSVDDELLKCFKKMHTNGATIITAAGNSPCIDNFLIGVKQRKFKGGVLVGSQSEFGLPDFQSIELKEVTISGPAGSSILTKYPEGLKRCQGSSSSAPLVTGSIANALSLLAPLSSSQIKFMLRETALKTIGSFQKPQKNGAGMVNAYKLFRVAMRIRKKCNEEKLKGAAIEKIKNCQKKEILNKENYLFGSDLKEKKKLFDRIAAEFPGCADGSLSKDEEIIELNQCTENRKLVFDSLRKFTFLVDNDAQSWDVLSCIHKGFGLKGNSIYYKQMAFLAGGKPLEYLQYLYTQFPFRNLKMPRFNNWTMHPGAMAVFRACHFFGKGCLPLIDSIYKKKQSHLVIPALIGLLNTKVDQPLAKKLNSLVSVLEKKQRNAYLEYFEKFTGKRGRNLLKQVSEKLEKTDGAEDNLNDYFEAHPTFLKSYNDSSEKFIKRRENLLEAIELGLLDEVKEVLTHASPFNSHIYSSESSGALAKDFLDRALSTFHRNENKGNRSEIIKLLFKVSNFDLNKDLYDKSKNMTYLHYAVLRNEPDLVKLLLLLGARKDIKDNKGRTPLDYFDRGSNPKIRKLLRP